MSGSLKILALVGGIALIGGGYGAVSYIEADLNEAFSSDVDSAIDGMEKVPGLSIEHQGTSVSVLLQQAAIDHVTLSYEGSKVANIDTVVFSDIAMTEIDGREVVTGASLRLEGSDIDLVELDRSFKGAGRGLVELGYARLRNDWEGAMNWDVDEERLILEVDVDAQNMGHGGIRIELAGIHSDLSEFFQEVAGAIEGTWQESYRNLSQGRLMTKDNIRRQFGPVSLASLEVRHSDQGIRERLADVMLEQHPELLTSDNVYQEVAVDWERKVADQKDDVGLIQGWQEAFRTYIEEGGEVVLASRTTRPVEIFTTKGYSFFGVSPRDSDDILQELNLEMVAN